MRGAAASTAGVALGKVRWHLGASSGEESGGAGDSRLQQLLMRAEVETDGSHQVPPSSCSRGCWEPPDI